MRFYYHPIVMLAYVMVQNRSKGAGNGKQTLVDMEKLWKATNNKDEYEHAYFQLPHKET